MIITKTPYRISLFGGGTDYPLWFRDTGGEVLSAAINKYCYISCRMLPRFFGHVYRFVYSRIEEVRDLKEVQHPAIRSVMRWMEWDEGVEIHHDGDLPARAGLGSSSSFTVGLLNTLYAFRGQRLSKEDLARKAIYVEQHVIQEAVGSQDQVAAAYGGLNHIRFFGEDGFSVSPITLSRRVQQELESHFMLFFTGTTHVASDIASATLANFSKKRTELLRMQQYVHEALDVLYGSVGTLMDLGPMLHEAWQFKRSLSDQISNSTLDDIYETARKAGATGGKVLGAGGGGFMLFFVPRENHRRLREALAQLTYVPIKLDFDGSKVALYQPEL